MDRKLLPPAGKRDRPVSSLLELPADGVSSMLVEEQAELVESPTRRKPFKNLSNLMGRLRRKGGKKSAIEAAGQVQRQQQQRRQQMMAEDEHTVVESGDDTDVDDGDSTTIDSQTPRQIQRQTPRKEDLKPPRQYSSTLRHGLDPPSPQGLPNLPLRRFHSMYQTSKEKDVILKDNSLLHHSNIKTFVRTNDSIPRITAQTLHRLLNGGFHHEFDEIIVVDCRFDYEYNGGHIKDAINISSKQQLDATFMQGPMATSVKNYLVIFHCEFSLFRGPTMASHLRKSDRILNLDNYPHLTYPDILVLDGGYKQFFTEFQQHCFPPSYVEMNNHSFSKKCDEEMERFRLQSKLHERLNSFTTITLHAENMKILKRHRSINNLRLEDMKLTRSSTFSYSEDLQPPLAMFSRFGSSSSLSSTASSTASSGSDVSISNSPIEEMNEFWESGSLDGCVDEKRGDLDEKRSGLDGKMVQEPRTRTGSGGGSIGSSLRSLSMVERPGSEFSEATASITTGHTTGSAPSLSRASTQLPSSISSTNISSNSTISTTMSTTMSTASSAKPPITSPFNSTSFKFPSSPRKLHRPTNSVTSFHPLTSPSVSSPLSLTPLPTPVTLDTSVSHRRGRSIIDPINDTPVDFLSKEF